MESAQQPLLENQANSLNEMETSKARLQAVQGRLESHGAFAQKKRPPPGPPWISLTKDLKEVQLRLQRLEQPAFRLLPAAKRKRTEKSKEVRAQGTERGAKGGEGQKAKAGFPGGTVREAREAYKKKNFEEAKKKFDEYLKQSPKGKNREEALFKMAESLYEVKGL